MSAPVVQALAAAGITSPFQIQERVVPVALRGADVLAKSPTGSGKTLAFALPIVECVRPGEGAPAALVLVPTRELALQVADDFRAVAGPKRLRAGVAYGGAPVAAQAKRLRGAEVLVATPGRLQDLVER
ncbi:MAG TPA: DEAD/DEAH box helicase, partial [Gaiellaceae bacterium]|nr:DEAD/DEAH box helicase [Gaiellaceae bacterium]